MKTPGTTTLIPTRALAWGSDKTLPAGVPFDFPDDCAKPLLDAGDVTEPTKPASVRTQAASPQPANSQGA